MLRPETRARARAVQLLYAWQLQDRPPIGDLVASTLASMPVTSNVAQHAERLFRAAAAHADESDGHIRAVAEHWRLERVGMIERTILRVALAELVTEETPPRVVIDEAVQLARWFAGTRAPAFVNGVLDSVARNLGRL